VDRPSCRSVNANRVRFQLHALAHNLSQLPRLHADHADGACGERERRRGRWAINSDRGLLDYRKHEACVGAALMSEHRRQKGPVK
jgi:hypothetical protein